MGHWIAIDWGTSSLRAWWLDENNRVIDFRTSGQGVKFVKRKDFGKVFTNMTEGWLKKNNDVSTIIACGMVGSSIGWKEAPYVRVGGGSAGTGKRSGSESLVNALREHMTLLKYRGQNIHITPGLAYNDCDVMRGEEVILLGLFEWLHPKMKMKTTKGRGIENYLAILPGTHSKWIAVKGNSRVDRFTTFITGEMFEILSRHSILKSSLLFTEEFHRKAFAMGLKAGKEGLLGNVFGVRARHLLTGFTKEEGVDYLSGVLLSEEVRGGLADFYFNHSGQGHHQDMKIYLVGDRDSKMIKNYRSAFQFYGVKVEVVDASSLTLRGLTSIRENELKNNLQP